jgi:hypothetical protein
MHLNSLYKRHQISLFPPRNAPSAQAGRARRGSLEQEARR